MGLKSHHTLHLYLSRETISLQSSTDHLAVICLLNDMPFVQKKNLCVKFIQPKSGFLLTVLLYNSELSLVFMALKENGYQYLPKERVL